MTGLYDSIIQLKKPSNFKGRAVEKLTKILQNHTQVKLYFCCTSSTVFTIANHHTTLKNWLMFKMALHRPRLDGRSFR